MNSELKKATEILREGGIVIFPTDTAFGIGCRIDREDSVKRLFQLRRRSLHKATPVLVSSIDMARLWVDKIPKHAKELIDMYWPGGLTVVLNSKDTRVSNLVKGGTHTLGLRMPDHHDITEVIEAVGVPIIGSSANFEGEKTPYSIEDLDDELAKSVAYVLPGECTTKLSSTVVDCTGDKYVILRKGAVSIHP